MKPPARRPRGAREASTCVVEAVVLLRTAREGKITDPEFTRWVQTQRFRNPKTDRDVKFESLPPQEQERHRQRWLKTKQKPSQDREPKKGPEPRKDAPVSREKLMSLPKAERPSGWVTSDDGNRFYGPSARIGDDAEVKGSRVSGTVEGKSKVVDSDVSVTSEVTGNASLKNSSLDNGAVVEDDAKLDGATVDGRVRVRGNSDISDAKIRGGTWDNLTLKGSGGTFHDSYDQKTLDVLAGVKPRGGSRGPGDGPLVAMTRYLADGGRTKGWVGLGKDLDRDALQKKIQRHTYEQYDRKNPWLGRGASYIDQLDDDGFDHLMGVAQQRADKIKADKRKKKAMLYQLTKTALEQPELRGGLMPLVRLAAGRVASGDTDLRKVVIRTAYETSDPALKKALLHCVAASDEAPSNEETSARALRPEERKALVRRAYESTDREERRRILERVKQADEQHDALIEARNIENDAWESPLWVDPSEYSTLVRVAYGTSDTGRRREILGILKEAKYSPGFMKYVEKQTYTHPETKNEVKFVSLPSKMQKEIHEQWKAGKKDWAKQFKPDGLGSDTELTPEKFDALKPGDRLWVSWAPHVEHRVTGYNKTKTGKPVVEMVMVNPETGDEGEERYLHRSSAGNPKHDIHVLPEPKSPVSDDAKSTLEGILGQQQVSEWLNKPGMVGDDPDFSDEDAPYAEGVTISIEEGGYAPVKFEVLSGKLVKGPKGTAMLVRPLPGQAIESPTLVPVGNKHEPKKMSEVGASEKKEAPKFKGKPLSKVPELSQEDDEALVEGIQDVLQNWEGGSDDFKEIKLLGEKYYGDEFDDDVHASILQFIEDAFRDVAREAKEEGVANEAAYYGNQADDVKKKIDKLKSSEKPKAEKPKAEKPEESPAPSGKHKDRKELVGKGKPDTAKVKMTAQTRDAFVPDGLSDEARKATEKGFKDIDFAGLKKLKGNVQAAIDDPEGAYAKALEGSGYTPGELSKMHATIKTLLKAQQGRKYAAPVLEISNKYDLEGEDADELYDFKADKPNRGSSITDAELFQKFLAKASPETRERMQGMDLKDFMVMYKSIMDEDEEDA